MSDKALIAMGDAINHMKKLNNLLISMRPDVGATSRGVVTLVNCICKIPNLHKLSLGFRYHGTSPS